MPIVVFSATHDRVTMGAAIAAGARGFIAKTAGPVELLDAIRTVLAGGKPVTRDIAPPRVSTIDGVALDFLGLTQRQTDVMLLLRRASPTSSSAATSSYPRAP